MQLKNIIETHWYKHKYWILSFTLSPFSLIFKFIVNIRRLLYKYGLLKQYKLPVPVIIIGNISVGGVGKTPLTKYLAHQLHQRQIKTGVILRGYKGSNRSSMVVDSTTDSLICGDEALIYTNSNIPVAIGRDRYQAGITLLKQYPDLQIILSDDGLQHYQLFRDYEIAVIDSQRLLNNHSMLPNGSLREPTSRLSSVDYIIISDKNTPACSIIEQNTQNKHNAQDKASQASKKYHRHSTTLESSIELITRCAPDIPYDIQQIKFDSIINPAIKQQITKTMITDNHILKNKKILICTAIGNPDSFIKLTNSLGIEANHTQIYEDHHYYTKQDISVADFDFIFTTEKDYTKLKKFNINNNIWVITIKSSLVDSNNLINNIIQKY